MTRSFSLAAALALVACGPPEAPETLDDLSSFLFEHVWDEDEEYLEVGLANLSAWLDDNFEANTDEDALDADTQEAAADET